MSTPQNASQKSQALIQVEDLKVYYPVKGGIINHVTGYTKAVDGVSFSIMEGEILGLVGESGCGKSTIGRQLVGLENPTEGKIYYEGRDLSLLKKKEMQKIRTQLQMVFQDPYSSLNPRKHIYEILSQPMLYHGVSTKETVEKDMVRILDMVGLARNVLGRYPHEFSGGQRQRIGIARALSLNPRFIVCDEPVSALDVSIQAQILNLLKSLQKELHLTLLFVGHGLGAVNYVSDRIAVQITAANTAISNVMAVLPHWTAGEPDFRAFFSMALVTKTMPAQAVVIIAAIKTPTDPISTSISAVSAGSPTAVRNGNQGVSSPCQRCSKASRTEPPQSILVSHFSFLTKPIRCSAW